MYYVKLLRGRYLSEIFQTSSNVEIIKNVVIKWMFLKPYAMESTNYFFEMKEGCKVSCVKLLF